MIRGACDLPNGQRTEIMHVIGWKVIDRSTPEYRARILAHIRSILLERCT